jgi:glycosyltransferase involved in cell wall biosynthesis
VKEKLKSLLFGLLRKDPEAVVVSFWSGEDRLAQKMVEEVRQLVPERRHFVVAKPGAAPVLPSEVTLVEVSPGSWFHVYRELRQRFRRYRIGLAPVLMAGGPDSLRAAAFLRAPGKVLAYNAQLERHHLRLRTWIASLLFLRGIPVDRIYLRPRWLCPWKNDRSVFPAGCRILEGRSPSPERRRVAILSPYFPYPLAHGGAVRIFHLLREAAREYDLFLFAFSDGESDEDYAVVREFCARVVLVEKTRYREPRWSTLDPPEVHEFDSPAMREALVRMRREFGFDLVQVEYTHLAGYGGDVLVEHDVTFDLFQQVLRRQPTLSALWNFLRWRRYELTAIPRFARIVTMSPKDTALLGGSRSVRVIENGVDIDRFQPEPETPGQRLLFIGSFRHFPNVAGFRFFVEQVWPKLRDRFPELSLSVVCGPDHLLYWREFTRTPEPHVDERVRLLGFVRDVRPLYVETNLVIVPTTVSAGTNVKVLEAMAMQRAVVSTPSGCAGLGLVHGTSVWVAGEADAFAAGIARLLQSPELRSRVADAARELAERHFDWKALGEKQRSLYRELLEERRPRPPMPPPNRRRGHAVP